MGLKNKFGEFFMGEKNNIKLNRPKNHVISHWAIIGLHSKWAAMSNAKSNATTSAWLASQMSRHSWSQLITHVIAMDCHRCAQSMMIFGSIYDMRYMTIV
jgi:hypothetical protein